TSNQQHQGHSAYQNQKSGFDIANQGVTQWHNHRAPSLIILRILLLKAARNGIKFSLCLPLIYILLQACNHVIVVLSSYCPFFVSHRQRRPDCCETRTLKLRTHHSDHSTSLAIQSNALADNRGIRTKVALPERVTENHHVVVSRLVFIRDENTA